MAPLAGSMRSSEPKESSTHTDPAPDVMLTGWLSGPPTRSVLVTRLAARSGPTIWLAVRDPGRGAEDGHVAGLAER
jgi:hypothetical protein